jgi:hypothetical protein
MSWWRFERHGVSFKRLKRVPHPNLASCARFGWGLFRHATRLDLLLWRSCHSDAERGGGICDATAVKNWNHITANRPSALELPPRGSSLRENTIPEKGENKILPGWINVSGCDSEDSSAAFGVGMTRSGRPFLATDNTRDFSISIRLA